MTWIQITNILTSRFTSSFPYFLSARNIRRTEQNRCTVSRCKLVASPHTIYSTGTPICLCQCLLCKQKNRRSRKETEGNIWITFRTFSWRKYLFTSFLLIVRVTNKDDEEGDVCFTFWFTFAGCEKKSFGFLASLSLSRFRWRLLCFLFRLKIKSWRRRRWTKRGWKRWMDWWDEWMEQIGECVREKVEMRSMDESSSSFLLFVNVNGESERDERRWEEV